MLEMKNIFNRPNGVGIMDVTLIEMHIAPSCIDTLDYHGRKRLWSFASLDINDMKRKIHTFLAGFP